MEKKHRITLVVLIVVLAALYFLAFAASASGWGYAGHDGYDRGPSFFYFGSASYYPGASVRGGSTGGPSHVGGGPGGGK